MFWRKKASTSTSPSQRSSAQSVPPQPPKPILKVNTEGVPGPNIRFAGAGAAKNPSSIHSQPLASSPGLNQSHPRIREGVQTPRVVVSQYETYSSPQTNSHPHQRQRQSSYDSMTASTHPRIPSPSARRSSRPTSPSATSFGSRVRARTEPANVPLAFPFPPSPAQSFGTISSESSSSSSSPIPAHSIPLATPPMPSSHVTTPPTAYVSSFQSRAPPPPSPYRPTNERARSSSITRNLPEQLPMMETFAPMSARDGLFPSDSRTSVHTLPGQGVPMLNVIPATPQDLSDEFPGASSSSWRQTITKLEEAVRLEGMDEVPLDGMGGSALEGVPSIDVDLHFSPFEPLVALPDTDSEMVTPALRFIALAPEVEAEEDDDAHTPQVYPRRFSEDAFNEDFECDTEDTHAPSGPLPPSPPFPSYPSLPSLTSQASMQTSGSETSMPTSESMSSIVSFPDVEEALGSMLASLSDSNMSTTNSMPIHAPVKEVCGNPGLGLGLELELPPQSESTTTTAPLSPRRRAPPPAPLDLSKSHIDSACSVPPIINHRVAFYGTAKAHPNSPSSGIFTSSSSASSSCSSSSTISLSLHQRSESVASTASLSSISTNANERYTYRDSISLASEGSDDDLHTASIISLTPIMRSEGQVKEMREELGSPRLDYDDEQRTALGLGLGLGMGMTFGMGPRIGRVTECHQVHEVGVAL